MSARQFCFGSLPWKQYHRAQRLGDGACGAVNMVYDDDGAVFAMKTFEPDEEDETTALETFRELAMLRILSGENAHPNIVGMSDLCVIEGELCMVMPKFVCDLKGAIQGSGLKQKGLKLRIAHGLLSAVAYLHENGVMHRDIKTENVMFTDKMCPVLIDFGLAKITNKKDLHGTTHTTDCGTAGYMAPEVYAKEKYDISADIWSVGIVLLETFVGELKCERDKAAFQKVKQIKADLPDKPVPNLLKQLLDENPSTRITAKEALMLPIFASNEKFQTVNPKLFTMKTVTDQSKKTGSKTKRKGKNKTVRHPTLQKVCRVFEIQNDFVLVAASAYHNAAYASPDALERIATEEKEGDEDGEIWAPLDDITAWVHCVILAVKIYEQEKIDVSDCDEEFPEICENFELDRFIREEKVILKSMNYCMFLPIS
eukprot:GSMAST32.ASY1.ANO1.1153.1 assembled CDS